MSWLGATPPQGLMKGLDRWLKAGQWLKVGQAEDLLWGEVRTRGSLVYRMALDRNRRRMGCNCPSVTQPCVHVLALLVAWQDRIWDDMPESVPPDWVERRLQSAPSGAPDRPRAVKPWVIAEDRLREMAEGYLFLETWLEDQTRQGWTSAMEPPAAHIGEAAARLVSQRLPGPARWLRSLSEPASDWEEPSDRLPRVLAGLFLAGRIFRRPGSRDLPIWPHLLLFSGATLRKEQVIQSGEAIRDHWLVLSNTATEEEDGLQRRDNWLFGLHSRRPALWLSFAWRRQPLEPGLPAGRLLEGVMHFYPGTSNLRAIPGEQQAGIWPATGTGPYTGIREAMDALAHYRTLDPWSARTPLLVGGSPILDGKDQLRWRDARGDALPLSLADPDQRAFLQTFRGLEDIALFGLYQHGRISPLSLVHRKEVIPLAR